MDRGQDHAALDQVGGLSRHRLLDRRCVDHVFRRRADAHPRFLERHRRPDRLCHGRGADRHDLLARRVHARTGVHLHVPLAAHPDRDARREEPDRHLQGLARRAARQRQEGGKEPRTLRRLHRLPAVRRGVPDRHRHPRGPADRLHHLRAVHRRLRPGDEGDRAAARPHRLRDARPMRRGARGRSCPAGVEGAAAPAHLNLFRRLGGDRRRAAIRARHPHPHRPHRRA